MVKYDHSAYADMLGNISMETMSSSPACIAQCTGCMCNCRCSCSGGLYSDFDWEEV